MSSSSLAQEPRTDPGQIITAEGVLRISDGSSIYEFNRDGSFTLEPLAISGRSISGSWTAIKDNSRQFEVTGEWGWTNGVSAIGDHRRMVVAISPLSGEKRVVGVAKVEVYDAYFLIEELTKAATP